MSKFNKLLDAKFEPPKRWTLDSSLIFDSDKLSETDKKVLKKVIPSGFYSCMQTLN